jgi:hypothetical protein
MEADMERPESENNTAEPPESPKSNGSDSLATTSLEIDAIKKIAEVTVAPHRSEP